MTISGTMPLLGHCVGCSADLSCADPAGYGTPGDCLAEGRETDLGSVRKPEAADWGNPDDLVRV